MGIKSCAILLACCFGLPSGHAGSLGVACHRAGLRYLGVEIDPEHYATAKARLQRETAQGLLCMPNAEAVRPAVAGTHQPLVGGKDQA